MAKYEELDKLREQYIEATGDVGKRKYEAGFNDRMINWFLQRNKTIMLDYQNLLKEMGILSDVSSIAEIGKNAFDTAIDMRTSAVLITPYKKSFLPSKHDKREIIHGELRFYWEEPVIANINGDPTLPKEKLLPFDYLITHNPYSPENIKFWDRMHNRGKGIAIGVFGNVEDKDYMSKINMLKEFRALLKGEVEEELITKDNEYIYMVASKKKIRSLADGTK